MCFGGGGDASSTSAGHASAEVSFTPTITIGGNAGDPNGEDTASTFAAQLLAAPPVRVPLPDPSPAAPADDSTTKLLLFVAVALAARKVLRG